MIFFTVVILIIFHYKFAGKINFEDKSVEFSGNPPPKDKDSLNSFLDEFAKISKNLLEAKKRENKKDKKKNKIK